jgi:hypothetical protein
MSEIPLMRVTVEIYPSRDSVHIENHVGVSPDAAAMNLQLVLEAVKYQIDSFRDCPYHKVKRNGL